jgi:hypothetical protein
MKFFTSSNKNTFSNDSHILLTAFASVLLLKPNLLLNKILISKFQNSNKKISLVNLLIILSQFSLKAYQASCRPDGFRLM